SGYAPWPRHTPGRRTARPDHRSCGPAGCQGLSLWITVGLGLDTGGQLMCKMCDLAHTLNIQNRQFLTPLTKSTTRRGTKVSNPFTLALQHTEQQFVNTKTDVQGVFGRSWGLEGITIISF